MTPQASCLVAPLCFAFMTICLAASNANAQAVPSAQAAPEIVLIDKQQASSMNVYLKSASREPFHLLYMHGIGATGAGGSNLLQTSICKKIKKYAQQECESQPHITRPRDYADEGAFSLVKLAPDLAYMGAPVWATPEQWHAAAPFVDHYVINLKSGKSILVDELNWWPLVMAFKCQHLIPNETKLAGHLTGSQDYLRICSNKTPHDGQQWRFDSYDWLTQSQYDALKDTPNRAALANRWLKISFLDWSLSDAALGIGPLEKYLVEGIRQLIVKCVETGAGQTKAMAAATPYTFDQNERFMTVTHSLGSFLMFSALQDEYKTGKVRSKEDEENQKRVFNHVLGHLGQAYFFANQIPLLELGKLGELNTRNFVDLSAWGDQRRKVENIGTAEPGCRNPLGQIVSWSDPSDLLTFYFGKDFTDWQAKPGTGICVVNKLVKNSPSWYFLGLLENPGPAHTDYARNPNVIKSLLASIP